MNRHGERLTYPDYGREEILRDFAAHRMIVEQDDGVRRHLRFRNPASSTYWFDLVTWNGVLVINGDCGTYAFARLTDMFEFFRGGNGRSEINPCYWAGKLLASDQSDGHLKYSEQLGRDAVAEEMCRLRERGAPNEVVRDLRDAADRVRRQLQRHAFGGQQQLVLLDEACVRLRQDRLEVVPVGGRIDRPVQRDGRLHFDGGQSKDRVAFGRRLVFLSLPPAQIEPGVIVNGDQGTLGSAGARFHNCR